MMGPKAPIMSDAASAGGCVNGVEEPFKQFFRGAVAQRPARASVLLASGTAAGVCKNASGWPCRRPHRAAARLPRWTASSRSAWQRSVCVALALEMLDSSSFFTLMVPSLLAFCGFCDVILAVHSDRPPLADVVWELHSTMRGRITVVFLSGVQLHDAINLNLNFLNSTYLLFAKIAVEYV